MSIRLMFAAGSADDPAGCEGLAALTGALLAEGGTRAVTYEQLLAELYPMAAGIGVHVDRDVTVVHGTVHRDHLDRYYDLVRQVVLEPRWETKEFERLKDDQRNGLVSGLRAVDDEGFGMESLASLLYPGHPYGRHHVPCHLRQLFVQVCNNSFKHILTLVAHVVQCIVTNIKQHVYDQL